MVFQLYSRHFDFILEMQNTFLISSSIFSFNVAQTPRLQFKYVVIRNHLPSLSEEEKWSEVTLKVGQKPLSLNKKYKRATPHFGHDKAEMHVTLV